MLFSKCILVPLERAAAEAVRSWSDFCRNLIEISRICWTFVGHLSEICWNWPELVSNCFIWRKSTCVEFVGLCQILVGHLSWTGLSWGPFQGRPFALTDCSGPYNAPGKVNSPCAVGPAAILLFAAPHRYSY